MTTTTIMMDVGKKKAKYTFDGEEEADRGTGIDCGASGEA